MVENVVLAGIRTFGRVPEDARRVDGLVGVALRKPDGGFSTGGKP